MMRSPRRFTGALWLAANLVYLCGHPCLPLADGIGLRSFAVTLVVSLLPGAAWFRLKLAGRNVPQGFAWGLAAWLVAVLLASALFQVAVLATLISAQMRITPGLMWNASWIATNLLLLVHWATGRDKNTDTEPQSSSASRSGLILGALAFFAAYALYAGRDACGAGAERPRPRGSGYCLRANPPVRALPRDRSQDSLLFRAPAAPAFLRGALLPLYQPARGAPVLLRCLAPRPGRVGRQDPPYEFHY